MDVQLKNKVVWITGGSEGIGRSIAMLAAESGATVAVTARDREPLDEVVTEIERRYRGHALAAPADVSSDAEMKSAVKTIVDRFDRIDIVVANAGTNGVWAPIHEVTCEEWTKTIAVNLTGTYLAAHHAVPHMNKAGGGSIVIISSVNGTRVFSNTGATAYASSKAGQLALGQMLALELAPSKIRVNVICPGATGSNIHDKTERRDLDEVETPVEYPEGSIPLTGGDMGSSDQVARLAVFLASDAASHITGTPVWIDGAESLLQG